MPTVLREVQEDVILSPYGEPLCVACRHPHTEGSWVDADPDDGTCWNAGSFVCGCPKFITVAVQKIRSARYLREHPEFGPVPTDD